MARDLGDHNQLEGIDLHEGPMACNQPSASLDFSRRTPGLESGDVPLEFIEAPQTTQQWSEELEKRDRRIAELEDRCRDSFKQKEILGQLVGKQLVPGAIRQLVKLWDEQFEVIDESGSFKLVTKDGITVERQVTRLLSSDEYAHFCLASSRGGTANRATTRPTVQLPSSSRPTTLGDEMLKRWQSDASRQTGGGATGLNGRRCTPYRGSDR